jgi:hypothetical protein
MFSRMRISLRAKLKGSVHQSRDGKSLDMSKCPVRLIVQKCLSVFQFYDHKFNQLVLYSFKRTEKKLINLSNRVLYATLTALH